MHPIERILGLAKIYRQSGKLVPVDLIKQADMLKIDRRSLGKPSELETFFEENKMTVKKIITIRHVFERDYELEFKNEEDASLGSWLMVGDCMVQSGHDSYDLLTHDFIFDRPVSRFRTAKGMHINDCNLYNISQSPTHFTVSGNSVDAWLMEGETDTQLNFDDEEEQSND